MDEKQTAMIFKAFCDEKPHLDYKITFGEKNAPANCWEEINVTQPTLSHHI